MLWNLKGGILISSAEAGKEASRAARWAASSCVHTALVPEPELEDELGDEFEVEGVRGARGTRAEVVVSRVVSVAFAEVEGKREGGRRGGRRLSVFARYNACWEAVCAVAGSGMSRMCAVSPRA